MKKTLREELFDTLAYIYDYGSDIPGTPDGITEDDDIGAIIDNQILPLFREAIKAAIDEVMK